MKAKVSAALGLLAGVPLLANAIGWTLTAISVALLIALAVVIWRKVVGDGANDDSKEDNENR